MFGAVIAEFGLVILAGSALLLASTAPLAALYQAAEPGSPDRGVQGGARPRKSATPASHGPRPASRRERCAC